MGDYPLKIAKDYRVPEHQRVNAEKKKRQKLLLEESFHAIKNVCHHQALKKQERN
jgi:nitrite reductase/ring-hydroxylating ferredoxin subunit